MCFESEPVSCPLYSIPIIFLYLWEIHRFKPIIQLVSGYIIYCDNNSDLDQLSCTSILHV